jgi:hypothetical protein
MLRARDFIRFGHIDSVVLALGKRKFAWHGARSVPYR